MSEDRASTSRCTVPYRMTRTSSSVHCNCAFSKASSYFNKQTTAQLTSLCSASNVRQQDNMTPQCHTVSKTLLAVAADRQLCSSQTRCMLLQWSTDNNNNKPPSEASCRAGLILIHHFALSLLFHNHRYSPVPIRH